MTTTPGLRPLSRLVAMGAAIALAMPAVAAVPEVITFATPPEGSSGYLMASGFSKLITDKTPIRKVVLQTFGSSAAWPTRMQSGEINFGMHCGFVAVREAYYGTGVFEKLGRMRNVLHMAKGYGLNFAMNAVDPKITSIDGLKGKTVFVMGAHSDHVIAATMMMKASGLEYGKDVKIVSVRSPQQAIQGMLTARGDAFLHGLIPALVEVQRSKGLHPIPLSPRALAMIVEAEPAWATTVVRAGAPPLKPEKDVPTIELGCGIAAGARTDAETVYHVMKAIFDNLPEWTKVHPLGRQWSLRKAVEVVVSPFHEGAIRYLKEKGAWTPALAAKQAAALAK